VRDLRDKRHPNKDKTARDRCDPWRHSLRTRIAVLSVA
jgi:hypothetical protein